MFEFAGFRLDPQSRRLFRGAEVVPITVKAFDTLAVLVEHAGTVVDKDDLMRCVWPDAVVEEANLSQQIFLLRKSLGEGPRDHRFIQTVPRRGYRFLADVTKLETPTRSPGPPGPATIPVTRHPLRLMLELAAAPLALGPCPPLALSADGRQLAYIGRDGQSTALFTRYLREEDSMRIARTDGATSPFFSPDGRWIGFFAGGRLYKVLAAGGAPIALCETGAECRGACWIGPDTILVAPTPASGLAIVPADGGTLRPVTTLDFDAGERTHRWPAALPDATTFLYTVARAGSASFDDSEIVAGSLTTSERRIVLRRGSCARYVSSGHLVYLRGGSLMAVPFDPTALAVTGAAIPVVDHITTEPTGAGHFAFSQSGCLLYATGESHSVKRHLIWLDGRDEQEQIYTPDLPIEEPRVSPDGQRIAFGLRAARSDIWVYDLPRQSLTRATVEGDNFAPIWTPDGSRVTFSSNRHGPCHIFWQPADGGPVEELVGGDYDLVPGSPDGRVLLFTEYHPQTGAGIWMLTRDDGPPRRFVRSPFNDFAPAISPDGSAFAYASDETGRCEIYLASMGTPAVKTPISIDGGSEPVWARDGRRLYFRNGSHVIAADIDLPQRQRAGAPIRVADGPYQTGAMAGLPNFDVGADGRLLLIVQAAAQSQPRRLSVIVNWFDDIAQRLA